MMNIDYNEDEVIGGQALMLQIINSSIVNKDCSLLDELYEELKGVI